MSAAQRNRRALRIGALLAAGQSSRARRGKTAGETRAQVMDAERAFAATMARRDHTAFAAYVSEGAVYFGDDDRKRVLRGRPAVAAAWRAYSESPAPPYSWEPEVVEVLDSGSLALSTGPVRNPSGEMAGRFTSIWRREGSVRWRVIFDRGGALCG